MRCRSSSSRLIATIVIVLLTYGATFAAGESTTRQSRATELAARPVNDFAVAVPVKRLPDVVNPNRNPCPHPASRTASASGTTIVRAAARCDALPTLRRARSHAVRLRVRPPDDPLPPTVLT